MEDIRDTRPWFWILIAALAIVAIVALVIAISANNESVNQKKLVDEATAQIREELAGLDGAITAAEEFQEEADQLSKEDQKRIKQQVNQAVAGGEQELTKLKQRVSSLETEITGVQAEEEKLGRSVNDLGTGQKNLEAETKELDKRLTRVEKQVE
jgi:chromosome segregation ATPase